MGGLASTRRPPRGSEAAFDLLYRRYANSVYRFCLRRTRDADLAEDALAIVFLEAWRRRGDVDLTSRPAEPWLYGVARNVLRNQQRTLRRHNASLRDLGHTTAPSASDDVSERVERRQVLELLLRALHALPPAQRAVVGLCLLEDRSYESAAGALRIPIGTVRSRLSRARLHLALAVSAADADHSPHPTTTT
ncbi:MAG TPA: RNA polymerase sigma factor [Conexibacter sp.]|jgi:RNA polymerase sigma-70 factor (ECF subfamily)|nr:RNA polymerase sigma factor [Conexibacter sp.]